MAAHRSQAARPSAVRLVGIAGLAALGMALSPLATASADTPSSPAEPIIRDASAGVVSAGPSEVRAVAKGKVLGGETSKGALIPVSDGNAHNPDDARKAIVMQHAMSSFCVKPSESGISVFCKDRGR